MTGRYAPKIAFPGHSKWVAASQTAMEALAARPDISPLAVRVLFAAMSRCNRHGHAVFGPNELRELLGTVDTATGSPLPSVSASFSHTRAHAASFWLRRCSNAVRVPEESVASTMQRLRRGARSMGSRDPRTAPN